MDHLLDHLQGRVVPSVHDHVQTEAGVVLVEQTFEQMHPEIDVRIATSDDNVDFAVTDVDLAIRYGTGNWGDVHAERLMTEEVDEAP